MLTPEQYYLLTPYRPALKQSKEVGSCIQGRLCLELANLHNLFSFGHVDTTCGGCVTDMLNRLWDMILLYEKQNP